MNLRSLCEWRLVSKQRLPGSRKDYYQADTNVWRITARIIEERQRRELQPVQEKLEACRAQLPQANTSAATDRTEMLRGRIDALIEMLEAFESVSEVLLPLVQHSDADTLVQLVKIAQHIDRNAPPNPSDIPAEVPDTSSPQGTPAPSTSDA